MGAFSKLGTKPKKRHAKVIQVVCSADGDARHKERGTHTHTYTTRPLCKFHPHAHKRPPTAFAATRVPGQDRAPTAGFQLHLRTVLHTFTYQAMPSRWQIKGYSARVEIPCGQAVSPQVSGCGGESECGIHGHNCIRHPIQSNAAMQHNVQFNGQSCCHHHLAQLVRWCGHMPEGIYHTGTRLQHEASEVAPGPPAHAAGPVVPWPTKSVNPGPRMCDPWPTNV